MEHAKSRDRDTRRDDLTPEQYRITQERGTEPAYSGKYCDFRGKGVYFCVCCGNALFSSYTKFNTRTKWPVFFAPIGPLSVRTEKEIFRFVIRNEVACRLCNAHLGYVFEDGRPPTGFRYFINSAAMQFVAQQEYSCRNAATTPCPSALR